MSADHAFQLETERTLAKNHLLPRLRSEFRHAGLGELLEELDVPEKLGIDCLVQMALHKRATLPTLVGLLRHHLVEDFGDTTEASQLTADLIGHMAEQDLLNWDERLQLFVFVYDVTAQCRAELDRFQYPLPMVVKPKPLQSNEDTGYLTIKGSVMLGGAHTDDDVCLDHLDRMNAVELTINMDTVRMVQNRWRNIDRPKQGETLDDYNKRLKAFRKYDTTARDVIEFLDLANQDEPIHLTHRYDFRGRSYAQGYHVNYQGNTWAKAIVEFHHQELVTVSP